MVVLLALCALALASDGDVPKPTNAFAPQLVSDDPAAPSPYWLDDVRNCGPRCVAYVDSMFGGERTFREISERCPPLRDGVPLRDLGLALGALGWGATPFECSFGDLERLRHPAILHLTATSQQDYVDAWSENHFVVMLGYDGGLGKYLLYDPPNNVHWVGRRYLKPRFSGVGLLVAKDGPPQLETALKPRSLEGPLLMLAGFFGTGGVVWCRGRARKRTAPSTLPRVSAALLLVASLVCPACQGDTSPNVDPFKAVFDRRYFAGEVAEGKKVEHVFYLQNDSGAAFNVEKVTSSCTCTHSFVDGEPQQLAAGERVPLRTEFDTRGQKGRQRKTIVVETDAASSLWRRIEFVLEADVLRPVQGVPESLFFGTLARGQAPVTKYLTLEVNDRAWEGIAPQIACDGGFLKTTPAESSSPRLARYAVEVAAPTANGPIHGRVSFRYRKQGQELEVVVPIQAEVTGLLSVAPRRILLSDLDKRIRKRQRVRLKSTSGSPFRVVDLELPAGVSLERGQNEPAAVVQDLDFTIDAARLPAERPTIALLTDVADDGRIEIPLVVPDES